MSEKRYGTKSEKQAAYRERKKNLPASVLTELKTHPAGIREDKAEEVSEARESTRAQACNPDSATPSRGLPDSRGGQSSFSCDKKKYPNRVAWEIAVQRVERAVRYAQMFPNLIGSDDRKFQTLDWQYQNEGIKSAPK